MRFGGPVVIIVAAVVAVSLVEGAPGRLPGVALGSAVLLHFERVRAMFAIVVAVASVIREAWRGRLPTQLTTGGLAYEPESADRAATAADRLQIQLDELREQVETLAGRGLSDGERRE